MNLGNIATVLSGTASYLVVTVGGVYAFDDLEVSAEDLSATSYSYDAANQLTAMNVNGTTTSFTYDDWGRMVGKTQGSYGATYSYRFGDKLKSVTSNFPGETASVAYNYDGLGRRRLEQRDNTTATWFRWSGSEECGEYAGTVGSWTIGALQTGYLPGLATFAGSNPSTAEWRYHLRDHLGSVRQLSGQTKAALARYDYTPYGELMRSAGLPLTVGYTGHLWDSAIGQYYAPFRYYNPQTARWNMRDPLGFVDGPNVYAYLPRVNPISYKDHTGTFAITAAALIVIATGAVVGGIIGGLDQAGCSPASIAAGAALGGLLGGLMALFSVFHPLAGVAAGAILGGLDGYLRSGPQSIVPGFISGAIGGGISGVLATVEKPAVNFMGGVAVGSWISDGPKFVSYLFGDSKPGQNCLLD